MWLWSHGGHWTGLVCASSCYHEESPLHLNSLTRDLFCVSAQEQFVHLWIVLEQFGSSLQKASLLLLPHCRFFSGITYPDHTFPAARYRNCSTQRQARWNMQYHYWSVSLRLFPLSHDAEHFFTYPSHLRRAPLPGAGLHFHYPCFLAWCVASACQYQGLRACHLSLLRLEHYKSWCSSQAYWQGSSAQACPSCQMSLL